MSGFSLKEYKAAARTLQTEAQRLRLLDEASRDGGLNYADFMHLKRFLDRLNGRIPAGGGTDCHVGLRPPRNDEGEGNAPSPRRCAPRNDGGEGTE